ncbi:hypothetical protein [Solicola sp. PLA-1-18]|uniref:hypothetical protein n=1 Tax=Solicola sp. PLA-1-18 TaxID=3380532 RepID=UPI003B7FDF58
MPHLEVRHWDADNERGNEVTILGPRQLVISSYAVRRQSALVADQVIRLLRRGGWPG